MLSEKEAIEIKKKIIDHIEKNFPIEQVENAKKQIELMTAEQLENFLEKNNLLKEESVPECVFCSIIAGRINSCKIGENKEAIAILEINPISKGHSIVLSKVHSLETKKEMVSLTEEISGLLKRQLKPKQVKIEESQLFGHKLINILPIYENEDFNSPKKQSTMEELEKVKQEIEKVEEEIKQDKQPKIEEKKIVRIKKEKLWLPKRIP